MGGAETSPASEACGGRSVPRSQQHCLRGRSLMAQGNRRSRGPGSPRLCTSVTATRLMGQSFSCLDGCRIVAIHFACAFPLLTVFCSPPRPGLAAVTLSPPSYSRLPLPCSSLPGGATKTFRPGHKSRSAPRGWGQAAQWAGRRCGALGHVGPYRPMAWRR